MSISLQVAITCSTLNMPSKRISHRNLFKLQINLSCFNHHIAYTPEIVCNIYQILSKYLLTQKCLHLNTFLVLSLAIRNLTNIKRRFVKYYLKIWILLTIDRCCFKNIIIWYLCGVFSLTNGGNWVSADLEFKISKWTKIKANSNQ